MIKQVARTKAGFKKFMFLLEYVATEQGFQYGIITAQSALETGFGRKVLGRNLFGIKCTRGWLKKGGKCQTSFTHEEISGAMIPIQGAFRSYDSFEDSLNDYIRIIKTLKRYKEAWRHRDFYKKYFKAIAKAGYATDSKYTQKCVRIYEQHI